MNGLLGIDEDHGGGTLTGGTVLPAVLSSASSVALAQDGVWPPVADLRRRELLLQWKRNQLRIVVVDVGPSVVDAVMPVIERAAALTRLPRGWDSYDARPVSEGALRATIEFLLEYVAVGVELPDIVPTVHGGLQLEWHRNGLDVEAEVDPDGRVSFLLVRESAGECVEGDLTGNEKQVREWLARVSEQGKE